MDYSEKQREFERRLFADMSAEIDDMLAKPWNNYYGLVIYFWDLCNIGAACNSLEALDVEKRQRNTGLIAAEWERQTTFAETSTYADQWWNDWLEDESEAGEQWAWEAEYFDAIRRVIGRLQQVPRLADAPNLLDNFLWGIQWGDPSEDALRTTLMISERVNTASMHDEFKSAVGSY